MKHNNQKAISTAEKKVAEYRTNNINAVLGTAHGRYIKANSTGYKAVRLAGYLTSMGMVK